MFLYLLHGFYNGAVLGCESLKTGKNTYRKCEYFQPQKEYIERDPHLSAIVLFMVTTFVSPTPHSANGPPPHPFHSFGLSFLRLAAGMVCQF